LSPAPLAPALLALAELKPVSGRDLILAFVLGQEVECRIGLAISPQHYNKGWHITATCGVFGAAAGSGKLLRLTTEQLVWALGIASTQSSGLCECLGTPAKSVGVGNAVKSHLDRRREVIATMKALGASGKRVFTIYLTQVLMLAGVGGGIGMVLGALLPFLISWTFGAIIPLPFVPAFHPDELILALIYGLLTALAFALWPLGRAHDVPVGALFRDAVTAQPSRPRTLTVVAPPRRPRRTAALAALAALAAAGVAVAIVVAMPHQGTVPHARASTPLARLAPPAPHRVHQPKPKLVPAPVAAAPTTSPSWAPAFAKIGACVTDVGGVMSHAAIVCREYGMPAVVGTGHGTKIIKTGMMLRVDGSTGAVTIAR